MWWFGYTHISISGHTSLTKLNGCVVNDHDSIWCLLQTWKKTNPGDFSYIFAISSHPVTAVRSTIITILTFLLCAENEAIPVQNSSNFHDFGIEIFESSCICIWHGVVFWTLLFINMNLNLWALVMNYTEVYLLLHARRRIFIWF